MTLEELNAKYTEAVWLIARRSASTVGKALFFSGESLEDTTREIATIYGLTDAECAALLPTSAHGALAGVQRAAAGLFGGGSVLTSTHALTVAKAAIDNGRVAKVLPALVRAGPKAARAAAEGAGAASRASVWGWAAQAGYAAGSAGWFAYHARAFSFAAYRLVGARERLELPADLEIALQGRVTEAIKPVTASVAAGASVAFSQAGAAWNGAVGAGSRLTTAAGEMRGRASKRLGQRPADRGRQPKLPQPKPPIARSFWSGLSQPGVKHDSPTPPA